jgi:hypothetical protein
MLGTIYEWFYEGVLGVKAETEAYKTWRVKPPLGSEFKMVEGSVECPYGQIEVKYEKTDVGRVEEVKMWVNVPTSTTGYLLLSKEESRVVMKRLGEGGYEVERKGATIALKPGKYELTLQV